MNRSRLVLFLTVSIVLLAAWPALAQNRPRGSVRAPQSRQLVGVVGQVFVPGFGFRPVINELDASRGFHRRGFRRGKGFGFGGFFGGFHGRNAFGYGYIPFYQPYQPYQQTPTVVIVQQPAQYPSERVITTENSRSYDGGVIVTAGLPENWEELNLEEVAPRRRAPANTAVTLIALKDETLFPVTDYWLEDGLVFYVTSAGRQGSIPLRALDWETSARLNAERGVEFVLRSR
jgi:hypothetical protein